MAITHLGQAVDVLKKGGYDVEKMKQGNAKKYTLDRQRIKAIINDEKYNPLAALNKAGQLLKKSKFTRLTSHKAYDFSILQSQSNVNYQVLISKMQKILEEANEFSTENLEELKEKISKEGFVILKEAEKELKRANDIAKKGEEYKEKMKEFEKAGETEKHKMLEEAFKNLHEYFGLSDSIQFTEDPKKRKTSSSDTSDIDAVVKITLPGAFIGIVAILVGSTVAGAVTLGVFVGGPILAVLGCITYNIIHNYCSNTAKKRELMRINDHIAKFVKKLNAFEKYVGLRLKTELKKQGAEMDEDSPKYGELVEEIGKFLEQQEKLWKPYTTAAGKRYEHYGPESVVKRFHFTMGRKVSDDTKDRWGYQGKLGRLKQAIAIQYGLISFG